MTALGRFAPKPVPPGTIPPGHFAQIFERDCSPQSSGTIRSKTNLRVDSPIFIIYVYSLKIKFGDTVGFSRTITNITNIHTATSCIWIKRKTLSQTQGNHHNKRT